MSAIIVDIQEYRKKNAEAAQNLDADDQLIEVQIEIMMPDNENTDNAAAYLHGRLAKYRSHLREDPAKFEKMITKVLRNMELRMTLKVVVMCIISIGISTAILSLCL